MGESDEIPQERKREPSSAHNQYFRTARIGEVQEICLLPNIISAVISVGFFNGSSMGVFIDSGATETVGGPRLAGIIPSTLVGFLLLVSYKDSMRMFRLWPIRSAYIELVKAFLERDLSIVGGYLKWLMHYCFFVTTTSIIHALVASLELTKGILSVVSLTTTVVPILINLVAIRYQNDVLSVLAVLKAGTIALLFFILMLMDPADVFVQLTRMKATFSSPGFVVLLISSAFIGDESRTALTTDAAPVRAKADDSPVAEATHVIPEGDHLIRKESLSQVTVLLPIIATLAYVDRLPSPESPIHPRLLDDGGDETGGLSAIATVLSITIAVITSTALLHVASRSLFDLASEHSGRADGKREIKCRWPRKLFSVLCTESKFNVPWVAVLACAVLPTTSLVLMHPWIEISGGMMHSIVQLGAASCFLVRGCESWSHWRLIRCLRRNDKIIPLLDEKVQPWMMQRVRKNTWYHFHVRLSIVAAVVSFAIVTGGTVLTCLHNTTGLRQLPLYLVVLATTAGITLPKIPRGITTPSCLFEITDLHDNDSINSIFQSLNGRLTYRYEKIESQVPVASDIFGIIDSKWWKCMLCKISQTFRG